MRPYLVVLALLTPSFAAAAPTLVRSPSASGSAIAFVAHGDLWTARPDGGGVRRLLQSQGSITAERLSPDGRWVAYTERAHGGQDVYVVLAGGGDPRRLTFDTRDRPEANLVVAWTPDSRRVVFLSDRGAWASKVLRAFSAPIEGGPAQALPLDQAGSLSYSADGESVAYTRTFTDLASRKRYLGGEAEDVFTYDLAGHRLTRITDWKGTDTDPMWSGRRIYFVSDRGAGFRANIWRYDLDTGAFHQLTRFADYDVDTPTLGGGRIVFQQGGRLWALELADERLHELTLDVPDDGARTAPRTIEVGRQARTRDVTGAVDYAMTPDGGAAIVAAHGDLFSVALPGGAARDLTLTPAADEDHPAVGPDGRTVAYVTEADGAQQVAVRPLAGGAERRLTRFKSGVLYSPVFSPDGRQLAVADAEHDLWLVSLDGGAPVRAAFDPNGEVRDAAFSPDGRWLAFSTLRATGVSALHLYDLRLHADRVVSSALESDRLPAFAPDASALYFVSKRSELAFTTDRGDETTLSSLDSDGVYAATLGSGLIDGLMARAVRLPVTPGRIVSLETRGKEVVYEARPPALIDGDLPGETAALHALDVASGRDRVLVLDLARHVLSADGRRVLFQRDGQWRLTDLALGGREAAVTMQNLRLQVVPRAEWEEMFERAWRLDRDLFFSRVMNGSDWDHVHDAYARLLPRLGSRQDFLYLLSQMQGELATSHAFVVGLDADDPSPAVQTPRLGADLQIDPTSGRYRVARIYPGDPTRERFTSPLNAPTLQDGAPAVQTGDYLLAIDGHELAAPTDPDCLLLGHQGDVALSLSSSPSGPRWTLKVSPLESDLNLRQHDWVEANRRRVAALSGGRIGYIFLADFDALGSQDLLRQLQGQLDKEGLVIDVRWNSGGFTSQAVLDVLRRVQAGAFVNREGAVTPLPLFTAPRAMAAIANAETASDGDQFAYFFQSEHLGPVVGERTWGGVQGIKGPWALMDGTRMTIPKDTLASTDGRWLIENVGVAPDIAVARAPDEVETGRDGPLEAAVQVVLAELRRHPAAVLRAPPPLPAYPVAGVVPDAASQRGS